MIDALAPRAMIGRIQIVAIARGMFYGPAAVLALVAAVAVTARNSARTG